MLDKKPQTVSFKHIANWLDDALPLLHQSVWRELLTYKEVDMAEALFGHLCLNILRFVRQQNSDRNTPGVNRTPAPIRYMESISNKWIMNQAARKSSNPRKSSAVFWSVEPNHLDGQLPTANALTEMGMTCQMVTCKPKMMELLSKNTRNPVYLKSCFKQEAIEARQLFSRYSAILDEDPMKELPPFNDAFYGIDLLATIRKTFKGLLLIFYETILFTEALVNNIEPEILVVGYDLMVQGRAAALFSRKIGLKTACLMHGSDPHIVRPSADKLLVYGENTVKYMMNGGVERNRLVACGNPHFDNLKKVERTTHPILIKKLEIKSDQSWVLVATSGPGASISLDHHLQMIDNLLKLCADFPDIKFIIKLHKKDKAEYYSDNPLYDDCKNAAVLPFGSKGYPQEIFEWLRGCAAVLTGGSMVAIEAMMLDVPVVTMDFMGELRGVSMIDEGATLHATSFEELKDRFSEAIEHPLSHKEQVEGFLTNAFFANDGKSARRCADAIVKLSNKNQ